MLTTSFWMTAKRDGTCAECEGPINAGDRMVWEPDQRRGYCAGCGTDVKGPDPTADDKDF